MFFPADVRDPDLCDALVDHAEQQGGVDGTDGFGVAASLEGGYPLALSEGWILEPQAQAIFQAIEVDSFSDGFADISFDDTNSLVGRLGLRLARNFDRHARQCRR